MIYQFQFFNKLTKNKKLNPSILGKMNPLNLSILGKRNITHDDIIRQIKRLKQEAMFLDLSVDINIKYPLDILSSDIIYIILTHIDNYDDLNNLYKSSPFWKQFINNYDSKIIQDLYLKLINPNSRFAERKDPHSINSNLQVIYKIDNEYVISLKPYSALIYNLNPFVSRIVTRVICYDGIINITEKSLECLSEKYIELYKNADIRIFSNKLDSDIVKFRPNIELNFHENYYNYPSELIQLAHYNIFNNCNVKIINFRNCISTLHLLIIDYNIEKLTFEDVTINSVGLIINVKEVHFKNAKITSKVLTIKAKKTIFDTETTIKVNAYYNIECPELICSKDINISSFELPNNYESILFRQRLSKLIQNE